MKTETKPAAWRLRIGDSDLWSYCTDETDAHFHGKASGLRYVAEPLYPASRIEALEAALRDARGYAALGLDRLTLHNRGVLTSVIETLDRAALNQD